MCRSAVSSRSTDWPSVPRSHSIPPARVSSATSATVQSKVARTRALTAGSMQLYLFQSTSGWLVTRERTWTACGRAFDVSSGTAARRPTKTRASRRPSARQSQTACCASLVESDQMLTSAERQLHLPVALPRLIRYFAGGRCLTKVATVGWPGDQPRCPRSVPKQDMNW